MSPGTNLPAEKLWTSSGCSALTKPRNSTQSRGRKKMSVFFMTFFYHLPKGREPEGSFLSQIMNYCVFVKSFFFISHSLSQERVHSDIYFHFDCE